ncbi:MAG: hypothetical protein AW10_00870 [Candidatus Accumulibacter appositus]|uniref:Uncharacterized protein n=1 Tax=Candidatus Accumulibacter appositus TaxID=1454003 RepID=A0A011PYG2_9PROT|nr:MAG: hypothetical protein AW10_00870 [Candidatus Accumulibacter appositus]
MSAFLTTHRLLWVVKSPSDSTCHQTTSGQKETAEKSADSSRRSGTDEGGFGDRLRVRVLDSRGKLYAVRSRVYAGEKRSLDNALPAYTACGVRRPWRTPVSYSVSGARSAWRPPLGKTSSNGSSRGAPSPPLGHCPQSSRCSRAGPVNGSFEHRVRPFVRHLVSALNPRARKRDTRHSPLLISGALRRGAGWLPPRVPAPCRRCARPR